jgi:hypothetical protein
MAVTKWAATYEEDAMRIAQRLRIRIKVLILLVAPLTIIGCASQQPLSSYARTGDTVMVSLGGTDTNALVPVLRKENITATITDSANNAYPIKVRNVFRVFSDPTSKYGYSSPKNFNLNEAELEEWVPSNMGLWMAVVDLVDPNSGQLLPLATGPGKLSIASPELAPWIDYSGFGWSWSNGNLTVIPIEILPGTGSPNPLNHMQPVSHFPLDSLEPNPQIEVRAYVPDQFSTIVGGGTFVFRYVTADFGTSAGRRPRVTTTGDDQNVQLVSRYIDQADGTTLLTVLIVNPHGFNPNNTKTNLVSGRSLLRSLRVNIMWRDPATAIDDQNWQNSLQLVSGQFVDLDGNPLPSVTPILAKVR